GESNIRRWIIENDWLEAIIALPDQLFYNTGIYTYIWIVTNKKATERKGKVQLINATAFFQKMRKSLGQKRNELSEKHIQDITKIFGEFQENEYCKIFDNEDFGYRKITVERPLKLSFQVLPERIEALKEATAFQNLAKTKKRGEAGQAEIEKGKELQNEILQSLSSMDSTRIYKNRKEFDTALTNACRSFGIVLTSALKKAIIDALSERDETAEPCTDSKGRPEPDHELRDYENIPLKEDIHDYFKREVLPHVPDAWIDEDKTKIGYEIPFTRHFYKYTPPRPLEEIEADIKEVETEIIRMINEVTG
ncbi:MAG: N-6 DNA methylase, partial [Kiritimatiellae bacterium]|nr:N-6 DNA methylase [Kiritimatiellia bacterium]